MHADQFNAVVDIQLDKSRELLTQKSTSYNTDGDRLAAFKVAATTQGITPKQALAGMMVKHTGSIYKMIHEDTQNPIAVWEEKIMDHINYLLNLRAIVEEEQGATESDDALAALRKKLQNDPIAIVHEDGTPVPNANVFNFGVELEPKTVIFDSASKHTPLFNFPVQLTEKEFHDRCDEFGLTIVDRNAATKRARELWLLVDEPSHN